MSEHEDRAHSPEAVLWALAPAVNALADHTLALVARSVAFTLRADLGQPAVARLEARLLVEAAEQELARRRGMTPTGPVPERKAGAVTQGSGV